jgi:hypothetical protein
MLMLTSILCFSFSITVFLLTMTSRGPSLRADAQPFTPQNANHSNQQEFLQSPAPPFGTPTQPLQQPNVEADNRQVLRHHYHQNLFMTPESHYMAQNTPQTSHGVYCPGSTQSPHHGLAQEPYSIFEGRNLLSTFNNSIQTGQRSSQHETVLDSQNFSFSTEKAQMESLWKDFLQRAEVLGENLKACAKTYEDAITARVIVDFLRKIGMKGYTKGLKPPRGEKFPKKFIELQEKFLQKCKNSRTDGAAARPPPNVSKTKTCVD